MRWVLLLLAVGVGVSAAPRAMSLTPRPGQALPPCAAGAVVVNGGCWIPVKECNARSERGLDGNCYVPVLRPDGGG